MAASPERPTDLRVSRGYRHLQAENVIKEPELRQLVKPGILLCNYYEIYSSNQRGIARFRWRGFVRVHCRLGY